ncbi:MAG: hypothetical protein HY073_03865 [Deltaproteobacteria bacterium]|nr:hypothetical protein [Deltaproteobacteria bacterium]
MKMRHMVVAVWVLVLCGHAVRADQVIYKSPNKIDFVKIEKASKDQRKAGAFKHPHDFQPEELQKVLASIRFNKKALLSKDIQNDRLYDDKNIDVLSPYLMEAFKKAGPEEKVVVSYFTHNTKLAVPDDRLTVFETFVREDGLHLRFNKLYAKMLGDRTTMGSARASQEAQSLRVSLELQPGQNRIAWGPEEIIIDPTRVGMEVVPQETASEVANQGKPAKSTLPAANNDGKTIRVRMKELEQLKKDELITNEEYQKKHNELLKQL